MQRIFSLAVLLSISCAAIARPAPGTQINYPVIEPGQSRTLAIRIPAYEGSTKNYVGYSVAVTDAAPNVSGFRATSVECPPGFKSNVYYQNRGAVCYLTDGRAHPSDVMFVTLLNENAPEGHTELAEGIRVYDPAFPGMDRYPLHLYSVQP